MMMILFKILFLGIFTFYWTDLFFESEKADRKRGETDGCDM